MLPNNFSQVFNTIRKNSEVTIIVILRLPKWLHDKITVYKTITIGTLEKTLSIVCCLNGIRLITANLF